MLYEAGHIHVVVVLTVVDGVAIHGAPHLGQPRHVVGAYLDKPGVLALNVIVALRLLAQLHHPVAVGELEGLGVAQGIVHARGPVAAPFAVHRQGDGGVDRLQGGQHSRLVDDVAVGDDEIALPGHHRLGGEQSGDHVGLGVALIDVRGDAGTLELVGAVAADDVDVVDAAGAQGRQLVLQQWLTGQFHQALGFVVGERAQAGALTCRQNNTASQL